MTCCQQHSPRKDDDVEDIREDAKDADYHAEVTVDWDVRLVDDEEEVSKVRPWIRGLVDVRRRLHLRGRRVH